MKYDEDDAIKFIRETLPQEVSEKYSDDEILYVIDIIWDWYERNGYLKRNWMLRNLPLSWLRRSRKMERF